MRPSGVGTDRENRPASAGEAINHCSMRKVRRRECEKKKEREEKMHCTAYRVHACTHAHFFNYKHYNSNLLSSFITSTVGLSHS